jgi:hypothetical protein
VLKEGKLVAVAVDAEDCLKPEKPLKPEKTLVPSEFPSFVATAACLTAEENAENG